MTELPRFETCGRARLDDATVLGTVLVDRARIRTGDRDVETTATIAGVLHEPEARRLRLELGVELEQTLPHARFVLLEEVHGAWAMMATAPTRDAIASRRIGLTGPPRDGIERHRRDYSDDRLP